MAYAAKIVADSVAEAIEPERCLRKNNERQHYYGPWYHDRKRRQLDSIKLVKDKAPGRQPTTTRGAPFCLTNYCSLDHSDQELTEVIQNYTLYG